MASDASSDTPQDSSKQAPKEPTEIVESVQDAFEQSDAANNLDPTIVAQITEQVARQVFSSLREQGLTSMGAPPPETEFPRTRNNSTSTPKPPRDIHTPPSPPYKDAEETCSRRSSDSEPPAQDPSFFKSETRFIYERNASPPSTYNTSGDRPRPAHRTKSDDEETVLERMWQPLFDPEGRPTARVDQFLRGVALHLIEDYEPKKSLVVSPAKMKRFYSEVKLPDEPYPWMNIFSGNLTSALISRLYRELKCEHLLAADCPGGPPHIPCLTPAGFSTWMAWMIQCHPDDEYERFAVAVLTMPISNADDRRERFPKELSRRLLPKRDNLLAQQRVAAAMRIAEVPGLRATTFPPPPPPQPQAPPQSQSQSQASAAPQMSSSQTSLERDRAPYSSSNASNSRPSVSSMSSSEEPSSPPSVPIERERKPYSSKPGCGKFYEDSKSSSGSTPTGPASQTPQPAASAPPPTQGPFGRPDPPRQTTSTQAVPPAPPATTSGNSLRRSNSSANAPARSHANSYGQREHGPPPTSMPHGMPNNPGGTRHYRTNSSSGQRFPLRSRSPTVGVQNPYTRSEGNNVNDISSSYYQSNLYRTSSHSSAIDDDDLSASVTSHGSYGQPPRSASYIPNGMNGSANSTSAPRSMDPRKYALDAEAQRSDWMRRQAAAQEQEAQRYGGGGGSVPPQRQRRGSVYEDDGQYDRRRSMHGSYNGWADGSRRFG